MDREAAVNELKATYRVLSSDLDEVVEYGKIVLASSPIEPWCALISPTLRGMFFS